MGVEDPLIGRKVGSYLIEERLGKGGMGTVYRAVQPAIGKKVAIKFLASELNQDPESVSRFFSEARAVNVIGHENIVDIYDFGNAEGRNYFVMELLGGKSLEQVLEQEKALSPARAVDVGRQIARALAAAHQRNIVHRDLKPDNVFLGTLRGRNDFVKILDFGVAKLQPHGGKHKTASGAILGTPGYMAPEQATGDKVDLRADIYALALLLYRMLAGQIPFPGKNLGAILSAQLSEDPPSLAEHRGDVPPALDALVLRMLSRMPDGRPATMQEVDVELARVAQAGVGGSVVWALKPKAPPVEEAPAPSAKVIASTEKSGARRGGLVEPTGKVDVSIADLEPKRAGINPAVFVFLAGVVAIVAAAIVVVVVVLHRRNGGG